MKIKGIHEDEIKDFVEKNYKIEILNISYHPVGENGSSYILKSKQGKFFVKVFAKTSDVYKSIREIKVFIDFLYRIKTEDSFDYISMPIKNKNGNLISKFNGFPIVLEEYISGANPKKLLKKDYEELGRIIGEFQNIDPLKFGNVKKDILDLKWESKILTILKKYETKKAAAGGEKEVVKILRNRKKLIKSAVKLLKENVDYIKSKKDDYVLIHEDLHGLNLLKTKNKIYLIDWEGLRLALPERDLIFFRRGLNLNSFFKKEYDKARNKEHAVDRRVMKFYIVKRLLSDLTYFSELVIDRRESAREARGYLQEINEELDDLRKELG